METQERITSVIAGKEPDRIPVYIPGASNQFAKRLDEQHGEDIESHHVCICNGKDITPLAFLGIDCCDVPGPPHLEPENPLPSFDDDSLFLDIFGRVFRRRIIREVELHVYQGPHLTTEEKMLKWDHAIPLQIEPDWFERVYSEIIDCIENHHICPIFNGCDGLYSVLEGSIGVRNTAYLFHDYPEFLSMHLEKIFKVWAMDIKGILDAGGAFIMVSDDIGERSRPTITPNLVEQYLLPYYEKFVKLIHSKGGIAFFRTNGDVLGIIDVIIKAGFDAVHVTSTEISYLEEAKLFWGDEICLMGNVDCMSVLSFSNPSQVKNNVAKIIEFAKAGAKFMLGTASDLGGSVRLENVTMLVKTAKNLGVY